MRTKIIVTIVIICLIVIGFFVYKNKNNPSAASSQAPAPTQPPAITTVDPATLTQTYTHPEDHFSFKYPEGYTTSDIKDDTGETLVVQNSKGQGIQIHIQPIDEDVKVIDADKVKADVPDIAVINPQEVEIGNSNKGVAFQSDNPAFGGESREVWFAFNKNFYQISTYMAYDPLLQAIFQTWQFK